MSSRYSLICVSHDPAILVGPDPEWQSLDEALGQLARIHENEMLTSHEQCDLLIGRYSYPLVELICPPGRTENRCRRSGHPVPVAMDAHWLRLLAATMCIGDSFPKVKAAVAALDNGCWTTQRMLRLAPLLLE